MIQALFDLRRSQHRTSSFLAVLPFLLWYGLFPSQATAANLPGSPFVPGNHVPLSAFFERPIGRPAEILQFSVRSDIISWVGASNLRVAWKSGTNISYLTPDSIDAAGGRVSLAQLNFGTFVVVAMNTDAKNMLNDFPIVTHWSQSVNGGKGGPVVGAADRIGLAASCNQNLGMIDYDPVKKILTGDQQKDICFGDTRSNTITRFQTDLYGLFSGDPINPNATVPGYERYIGENYAILKPKDLAAVAISDMVLNATTYPVIHRNYPWAFDSTQLFTKRVMQGVPAWQVVHAYVIATAPDKGSLATFLIPPNWTLPAPGTGYPAVVNGRYDIHASFFLEADDVVRPVPPPPAKPTPVPRSVGLMALISYLAQTYGPTYGKTIGILWNGGGAYGGTRSFHRSLYDNATLLFSTAQQKLGVDPMRILAYGQSRGGITALALAGNPYSSDSAYKVKYVIAVSPAGKVGEWSTFAGCESLPAVCELLSADTGYRFAWKPGWTDPASGMTAQQLLLTNWFNTSVVSTIDTTLDPYAPAQISALQRRGTKVRMLMGTHDTNYPYSVSLDYANQLSAALGSNFRYETYHRLGHNYPFAADNSSYIMNGLGDTLVEMLGGPTTFASGRFHYKKAEDPTDANFFAYQIYAPFTPATFVPIHLEGPKTMIYGDTVHLNVTGSPLLYYRVQAWKLDDTAFQNGQFNTVGGEITALEMQGQLPNGTSDQWATSHIVVPNTLATGAYWYQLQWSADGTTWRRATGVSEPARPADSMAFFVYSSVGQLATALGATDLDGATMETVLETDGLGIPSVRSWGLSSDDDPLPTILANGAKDVLTVPSSSNVAITISAVAGSAANESGDLWVARQNPNGALSWYNGTSWVPPNNGQPVRYSAGVISDLSTTTVYNGPLPTGNSTFYFVIDEVLDNTLNNPLHWKSVTVTVTP